MQCDTQRVVATDASNSSDKKGRTEDFAILSESAFLACILSVEESTIRTPV